MMRIAWVGFEKMPGLTGETPLSGFASSLHRYADLSQLDVDVALISGTHIDAMRSIRELRDDGKNPNLPVLLLGTPEGLDHPGNAPGFGAEWILIAPFDSLQVAAAIARIAQGPSSEPITHVPNLEKPAMPTWVPRTAEIPNPADIPNASGSSKIPQATAASIPMEGRVRTGELPYLGAASVFPSSAVDSQDPPASKSERDIPQKLLPQLLHMQQAPEHTMELSPASAPHSQEDSGLFRSATHDGLRWEPGRMSERLRDLLERADRRIFPDRNAISVSIPDARVAATQLVPHELFAFDPLLDDAAFEVGTLPSASARLPLASGSTALGRDLEDADRAPRSKKIDEISRSLVERAPTIASTPPQKDTRQNRFGSGSNAPSSRSALQPTEGQPKEGQPKEGRATEGRQKEAMPNESMRPPASSHRSAFPSEDRFLASASGNAPLSQEHTWVSADDSRAESSRPASRQTPSARSREESNERSQELSASRSRSVFEKVDRSGLLDWLFEHAARSSSATLVVLHETYTLRFFLERGRLVHVEETASYERPEDQSPSLSLGQGNTLEKVRARLANFLKQDGHFQYGEEPTLSVDRPNAIVSFDTFLFSVCARAFERSTARRMLEGASLELQRLKSISRLVPPDVFRSLEENAGGDSARVLLAFGHIPDLASLLQALHLAGWIKRYPLPGSRSFRERSERIKQQIENGWNQVLDANYFEILRLPWDSEAPDIDEAYAKLSAPFVALDLEAMGIASLDRKKEELLFAYSEAHRVLSKPEWRSAYLQALESMS